MDYKYRGYSLFNNGGFEYSVDMQQRTLSAIRHYFFIDKKWPVENKQMALSLAAGFVWESAKNIPACLPQAGEKTIFSSFSGPMSSFEKIWHGPTSLCRNGVFRSDQQYLRCFGPGFPDTAFNAFNFGEGNGTKEKSRPGVIRTCF